MQVVENARHNGRVRLDHASLIGAWRNTDSHASGIRRLILRALDGVPRLRVLGAGRREPYDWGEVEATCYASVPNSWTAWAFTAAYDVGFRTMQISAYTVGGLLVVTTCNAFSGAGWPQPYWTREFFHRERAPAVESTTQAAPATTGCGQADLATAPLLPWELDPAPLVATWRNVDPAAARVSRVGISERGGYLVVRPHGVWNPRRHDWHETVGSAFADDVRTNVAVAFTAFFHLAVGRVEMVGYLDRRLLTIETGSVFSDGSGRAPQFVREHFYPIEGQP